MEKALAPDLVQIWSMADRAFKAGRFTEARGLYEKVCSRAKQNADAWMMLGRSCEALNAPQAARKAYTQAAKVRPSEPNAHFDLARVLHQMKNLAEAAVSYRRATALKPDFAEAHNCLGAALLEQGREHEAMPEYQRYLELRPDSAQAHFNLAFLFQRLGMLPDAAEHYRESLRLEPQQPRALVNLSSVLLNLGRASEAEQGCRRAVELQPNNAIALFNQAKALAALGRLDEALTAFDQSMRIDPELSVRLAESSMKQGADAENIATGEGFDVAALYARFQQGRLQRCDWTGRDQYRLWSMEGIDRGFNLGRTLPLGPLAAQSIGIGAPLLLKLARKVSRYYADKVEKEHGRSLFAWSAEPQSVIRIGYVSSDFRAHNHFHLIRNLLEEHDRTCFEVFGYSLFAGEGGIDRNYANSSCDFFRELAGVSDLEAARQIHADGIQILIDLNGYTRHCRPELFALRPAPIQVHYPIGCPSTTGADYIDYMVVDKVLVPPEMEACYTERLVFLPEGYQGNDYLQPISDKPLNREDWGLPSEGFVFCCLTNGDKIDPEIFDIWMAILREVPGSVLWLYLQWPEALVNLRKEAAVRGVDPNRLVNMKWVPKEEHLARQKLADLFLDTPIFTAHTTAVDALWVGLPLLTFPQQSFGSRVAASLLTSAGLPELIAATLEGYKAQAILLATDRVAYASIRSKVAAIRQRSPLFNTRRLVRHLEHAFQLMYARYVSGQPPIRLEVPVLENSTSGPSDRS